MLVRFLLMGFAFGMVVILCLLHTLHNFLLQHRIPQHFHHTEGAAVGIGGGGKHPFHPGIRFPAIVEEQVALPDGEHIRRCGLIAVQVRAAVEQQGELHLPGPVAEHLTHPVVFREDGGNNLQTDRTRSRLGLRGTAGEQSQDGEQAQSQGQHISFS